MPREIQRREIRNRIGQEHGEPQPAPLKWEVRGRESVSTAMLSRLCAVTMGRTIVIAIPGSAGAARDAVHVLIPAIFHAWSVKQGARHG